MKRMIFLAIGIMTTQVHGMATTVLPLLRTVFLGKTASAVQTETSHICESRRRGVHKLLTNHGTRSVQQLLNNSDSSRIIAEILSKNGHVERFLWPAVIAQCIGKETFLALTNPHGREALQEITKRDALLAPFMFVRSLKKIHPDAALLLADLSPEGFDFLWNACTQATPHHKHTAVQELIPALNPKGAAPAVMTRIIDHMATYAAKPTSSTWALEQTFNELDLAAIAIHAPQEVAALRKAIRWSYDTTKPEALDYYLRELDPGHTH